MKRFARSMLDAPPGDAPAAARRLWPAQLRAERDGAPGPMVPRAIPGRRREQGDTRTPGRWSSSRRTVAGPVPLRARASSTCSTPSASARCRSRSAAIPPPPGRSCTRCAAVGAVTAAICAARPGSVLGVRGPYGSSWPVARAAGRRPGDRRRRHRPGAAAPGRARRRSPRAGRLRPGRPALRRPRRPSSFSSSTSSSGSRRDGIEVHVTVDSASGDWAGHVGVVTTLYRRGPRSTPSGRSPCCAARR